MVNSRCAFLLKTLLRHENTHRKKAKYHFLLDVQPLKKCHFALSGKSDDKITAST